MECTDFVFFLKTVIGSMIKKTCFLMSHLPYVCCADHCLKGNCIFYFYSLVKSSFMECMMLSFFSFVNRFMDILEFDK
ncbi:hypothetical protein GDO81_000282 [Engystomops pustulosus]|uniref:Uncharacterized protein n=1 Tax=Engystomops pustulosus TaxID=76066 RepID=A0AAV7D2U0_ENGPU|nr:hypothetical protein GDO81_000282 [Engystomops pustulosus]